MVPPQAKAPFTGISLPEVRESVSISLVDTLFQYTEADDITSSDNVLREMSQLTVHASSGSRW